MIALVVHGGAWNIPDSLVPGHRDGVAQALEVGWQVLREGGSAVDAVERAVVLMENDETFDAGRGSFLNAAGDVELDASIMEGGNFRAGAVAAVRTIRNPISLARRIMEQGEEVLLVGTGAIRFAREHGIQPCSQDDLIIEREVDRWREAQGSRHVPIRDAFRRPERLPMDTVGAVALDKDGLIVAGTSTGGAPNKHPGRVGDSPLVGCGTYADNSVGGVSTTGWGEAMIKVVMAKTVIDIMEQNGSDASAAAKEGIRILQHKVAGFGGLVVLSPTAQVGVAFNTPRMARGFMTDRMVAPIVEV